MLPGTAGNGSRENGSGIFEVLARSTDEIVLGDNDRHLDLRVSLLVELALPAMGGKRR